MPHLAQRRCQLRVALRHPPQRPHRIAHRRGLQQLVQVFQQRRIFRCQSWSAAPWPPNLAHKRAGVVQVLEPAANVLRASPVARDDAVIPPYPAVRASAAPNRRRARSLRSRPTAAYRARIDDASAMPQHKRHRIVPESSPWAAHLRDPYRLGHCWVSPKALEYGDNAFCDLIVSVWVVEPILGSFGCACRMEPGKTAGVLDDPDKREDKPSHLAA